MALDIGAPGSPVEQRRFTDGTTAWGYYTGTYTVPAGQVLTRFAFRSISAAGGNQGIGNFLDGIFFGTAPYVELTKAAVPAGPLEVGDTVTYRVTAKNEGGGAAEDLFLTDVIPQGTTYLPGSLRVVDGPNAGTKSDARGDDQAYYDAGDDKVVFHLGNGASGVSAEACPTRRPCRQGPPWSTGSSSPGRAAAGRSATRRPPPTRTGWETRRSP